jgi:septal ring factor EnvC (AmiA/AmiB activator)
MEAQAAPRRSAWAALREFFTLTPAWARVGMVAASLLACALAVLAVVNAQFRWDDKGLAFGWGRQSSAPSQINVPQPAPQATMAETRYTQADIDAISAERDAARRELAAEREQLNAARQQVAALNTSLTTLRTQHQLTLASLRTARGNQANTVRRGSAPGMLVADNQDDEGLRLSDLLNEVSTGREQPQVKRNDR